MKIDAYLGFRIGDVVLDGAELTAGTAKIKEIHLVPSDWAHGLTAIAVMENGAERFIVQLKKVHPTAERAVENNILPLRHGAR
ncbi:hypothetical protein [Azospirillum thermophilum]|uniref:Uncharacterized protein n=1 Tax=Azospirillum thermophilum TaxID=2202148 RepID=A0A2S2CZQ3_9PROT|nr:hypothetical protein [Azospirillum thermophilum]AWK89890.1 hypothetical protein DEW08_28130 [Azospirillum thermophilum]